MVRLGIQSERTNEEMDALRKNIIKTAEAPDIRLDPEKILAAIEKIVEKTGDLDLARDNMRNLALAIQATGAEGEDLGAVVADLSQKFGLKGPEQYAKALGVLIAQGKKGAFPFAAFATQGERLTAAYAATGRTGPKAVREMGAMIQMAKQGTGSSEQAATAYERLLATITQEKTAVLLKEGIQLFDPDALAKGQKMFRSMPEIMKDIVRKTKGDVGMLSKVFGRRPCGRSSLSPSNTRPQSRASKRKRPPRACSRISPGSPETSRS